MSKFNGNELLRIWEESSKNGVSQRKLAKVLGIGFNALHGKIWRAQKECKISESEEAMKCKTYPSVLLRSAVFDIECQQFSAGGIRSKTICVCVLPLDTDKVTTLKLRFDDHGDDRRLLEQVCAFLSQFDILIGHNIAAFDFNWLNSRLMYHDLEPMRQFFYYDTYQAARRMAIKAERKSLAFLLDYFRIKNDKTAVYPVSWGMIDSQNEDEFTEALNDITDHCERDVRNNRDLFYALWERDKAFLNIPRTRKW